MVSERLTELYQLLYERFGPQHWWPGQGMLEIAVGAILTQNTNWGNVEKAIANLKQTDCLSIEALSRLDDSELARLIRPAGYYNVKTKRLKNFIAWLVGSFGGELSAVGQAQTETLREQLLAVKGIGPETADSILLYAFQKSIFVVDAYTARIASRHRLIEAGADYETLRRLFQDNLPPQTQLFNEYHALLVRCGKEYCRPRPRCQNCPLERLPHDVDTDTL
jgi:endonuclease-3 related protein